MINNLALVLSALTGCTYSKEEKSQLEDAIIIDFLTKCGINSYSFETNSLSLFYQEQADALEILAYTFNDGSARAKFEKLGLTKHRLLMRYLYDKPLQEEDFSENFGVFKAEDFEGADVFSQEEIDIFTQMGDAPARALLASALQLCNADSLDDAGVCKAAINKSEQFKNAVRHLPQYLIKGLDEQQKRQLDAFLESAPSE